MSDFFDERRYDPTPARLRRAEEEGQIAASPELVGVLVLIAAVTLLAVGGPKLWNVFEKLAGNAWGDVQIASNSDSGLVEPIGRQLLEIGQYLLLGLGAIAMAGWLAHATQVRFRIFPRRLTMEVSRISPVRGMARMNSLENFSRVALGLFKMVLLVCIASWVLIQDLPMLLGLAERDLRDGGALAFQYVTNVLIKFCAAIAAIALADYGVRWFLNRRRLRMTQQEVQEEQRSDGAALQITARRRIDGQWQD